MDGEDFDTDTIHDNSTNNSQLTYNIAGVYLLTCNMRWATNTTGERSVRLLLNGTTAIANTRKEATGTREQEIRITIADDVSASQVNSVVQAHNPASRTLDPTGQRNARIKELLAVRRFNWTAAQRNEAIDLIGQAVV